MAAGSAGRPGRSRPRPGQPAVLRGGRRGARPRRGARGDPPPGRRVRRTIRAQKPMPSRRPTRGDAVTDRDTSAAGTDALRTETDTLRTGTEPCARNRGPAHGDRRCPHRGPGPDFRAHRLRGRARSDPAALAADVAAGVGPRAHRQSGRDVAAADGRRPGPDPPGDRHALRRLRAPSLGAAVAAAAPAGRGAHIRGRRPRPGARRAGRGAVHRHAAGAPAASRSAWSCSTSSSTTRPC